MQKIMNLFSLVALALLAACAHKTKPILDPVAVRGCVRDYNAEELRLIEKDLRIVEQVCFDEVLHKKEIKRKKRYIATAGAPGSRKSTILERFLRSPYAVDFDPFVYLDPDQRALKYMVHTYQSKSLSAAQIAQQLDYGLTQKLAYEKWRGASNYITLVLLDKALQAQCSVIVHGTTSTGPLAPPVVRGVKGLGYEVTFLLCSSDDEFRRDSIQYRNTEQRFYQSTPEDAVSKGVQFTQRMQFFFESGDVIYLYWSESLAKQERLAAIFADGKEQIIDADAYALFIKKYVLDATQVLQASSVRLAPWHELVELYKARFTYKNV